MCLQMEHTGWAEVGIDDGLSAQYVLAKASPGSASHLLYMFTLWS